jgi:uncharacterized hydrophobic protein (TIGR00271 family)
MAFVSQALLVTCEETDGFLSAVQAFAAEQRIALKVVEVKEFLEHPGDYLHAGAHIVTLVDDDELAPLIHQAKTLDLSFGIVPLEGKSLAFNWFKLPEHFEDVVTLAFQADSQAVDLLYCNDDVVIGRMMLGKTPFLFQRSWVYRERRRSWFRGLIYWLVLFMVSVRNLLSIRPFLVTLTSGKGKTLKTAITGLVTIENDVDGAAAQLINTSLSVQDGKISTIVIAPRSISQYLAFLLVALFQGKRRVRRLPAAVSYFKSDYLRIESNQPMRFFVDGRKRSAKTVELKLYKRAVKLNLSEAYYEQHGAQPENKDTMQQIENLPIHDARLELIQEHLPLFTRALEEDYKKLLPQLRENAQASSRYIVLMVLSAVVATFGLFLSSAAVIIGAMLLAPLMGPILSLSMSLLHQDRALLGRALITIAIGVALALGAAAFIDFLIPIQRTTAEIAARLHPNLLDLGVAIAAGIAGAYAHARESVANSLPGVAIAVALVPPLCVSGIGIGWMDMQVISGALLLFTTNLVGLTLAAALTFLVLGYAPILRARQGLFVSLALMVAIAVPLSFSFHNIYVHWTLERDASRSIFEVNGKSVRLTNLYLLVRNERVLLRADVTTHQTLDRNDMEELQSLLSERWGREVALEVSYRLIL